MIAQAESILSILETATDLTGFEHDAGRVTVKFEHGVLSAQRVTMWAEPTSVHLGMWVGELKPQFTRVYSSPQVIESLSALGENGWILRSNFHVAFHNSNWKQRWYPSNGMPAPEYLRQWATDLPNAGRFPRHEIEDPNFSRWLVERGYITEAEVDELSTWLGGLTRQQVDVRPSLAIERSWDDVPDAADVRAAIDELLTALEEPILGTQRVVKTRVAAVKPVPVKKPIPFIDRPTIPCPNCFVALPSNGVCDCDS